MAETCRGKPQKCLVCGKGEVIICDSCFDKAYDQVWAEIMAQAGRNLAKVKTLIWGEGRGARRKLCVKSKYGRIGQKN